MIPLSHFAFAPFVCIKIDITHMYSSAFAVCERIEDWLCRVGVNDSGSLHYQDDDLYSILVKTQDQRR